MGFLSGVLACIGVLGLIVAAVGLLYPAALKDPKTGVVPSRGSAFGGGITLFLVFMVIAAVVAPDTEEGKPDGEMPEKAVVEAAKPTKTLGLSPEQFRVNFNSVIGSISDSYRTAEFNIESGDVNDTFQRSLADGVSLIGSVNKADGSLRELMVMVGGTKDMVQPVAVLLVASQVLNPTVAKEEIAKVVLDMVQKAMSDIKTGASHEQTLGPVHYTAAASEYTGLMFSISQAE